MTKYLLTAVPALGVLLLLNTTPRAEERAKAVPNYDQAVRDQAPKILAALKAKGYKNIGVLKFLVRNEGGPLRDNFGPINRTLPDRLEIALLLALDPDGDMGILYRASDAV